MVTWFGRGRERSEGLWPRSRQRSASIRVDRVALQDLRPEPTEFLGQAAYLQLALFDAVSRAAASAPDLAGREALSSIAGLILKKHHELVAELRRKGADPSEVMQRYAADTERYRRQVAGADWYESILSAYLTAGLLDDFFAKLAAGLPDEDSVRVRNILAADTGNEAIVAALKAAIARNSRLGSRLALWGRRLVGDTLLMARSAVPGVDIVQADDARIEPIFTELIAAHTRRMDGLGLTA